MDYADRLAMIEAKDLALKIGKGLSEKTKFLRLAPGTRQWVIIENIITLGEMSYVFEEVISLKLFFGMLVGYSEKFDILAMADL